MISLEYPAEITHFSLIALLPPGPSCNASEFQRSSGGEKRLIEAADAFRQVHLTENQLQREGFIGPFFSLDIPSAQIHFTSFST